MESPIALNSLVLGSLPERHARYRPHHTAVIVAARRPGERELRLTWREFDAYVNRWANALRVESFRPIPIFENELASQAADGAEACCDHESRR